MRTTKIAILATFLAMATTILTADANAETIRVKGNRIHYQDTGDPPGCTGDIVTALFIHGQTSSSNAFIGQLLGLPSLCIRAIAIDLPGYGSSDPAWDPAATYNIVGFAKTIRRFIKKMGLTNVIVAGHSIGGHFLYEAMPKIENNNENVIGWVTIGAPPISNTGADFATAFHPNPISNLGWQEFLTRGEQILFTTEFFAPTFGPAPDSFVWDAQRSDGAARTGVLQDFLNGTFMSERDVVAELELPLMIVHGNEDLFVNGDYYLPGNVIFSTLWNGSAQIIANAGHAPFYEQPDAFNNLLAAFAADLLSP